MEHITAVADRVTWISASTEKPLDQILRESGREMEWGDTILVGDVDIRVKSQGRVEHCRRIEDLLETEYM